MRMRPCCWCRIRAFVMCGESGRPEAATFEEPARWLDIAPNSYRDMQDFIATITEPDLAERFERAIQGRGALRRFRDALQRHPNLERLWLTFTDDRRRDAPEPGSPTPATTSDRLGLPRALTLRISGHTAAQRAVFCPEISRGPLRSAGSASFTHARWARRVRRRTLTVGSPPDGVPRSSAGTRGATSTSQ